MCECGGGRVFVDGKAVQRNVWIMDAIVTIIRGTIIVVVVVLLDDDERADEDDFMVSSVCNNVMCYVSMVTVRCDALNGGSQPTGVGNN